MKPHSIIWTSTFKKGKKMSAPFPSKAECGRVKKAMKLGKKYRIAKT